MLRRAGLLVLLLVGVSVWAADPSCYQRRDTWWETLLASREALVAEETAAAARPPAPDQPRLSPWLLSGPHRAGKGQNAFDVAFPPEQKLDAKAVNSEGKPLWEPRPEWEDGLVHELFVGVDHQATYLWRTITVAQATTLRVYLGSDDGLAVFLNGERLLAQDVPRGCGPNQAQLDLPLRQGGNDLLLKIVNITGGNAFYFSTSAKPGTPGQTVREQLWAAAQRDFGNARLEMEREAEDAVWDLDWKPGDLADLAARYAAAARLGGLVEEAEQLAPQVRDLGGLGRVRDIYHRGRSLDAGLTALRGFAPEAVRLGIDDLAATYGPRYPKAEEYRARLADLEQQREQALARLGQGDATAAEGAIAVGRQLAELQREALLVPELLGFDRLLVVRRRGNLGLPANWQGNSSLGPTGYDNELAVLAPVAPDGALTTLYRPEGGRFVGDLDLHFDGGRLLFSMPDQRNHWQVFELALGDGATPVQVTPGDPPDVQSFDGCYLPDGRIVFCSTACYQGVPCVAGSDKVSLLYLLDRATGNVRQLTFDQDHSWDPTVLNDGRVLYTRWEYSDTPHYFTRLLFSMNPDGTGQMATYGSNSYWPNSTFYARPLPGDPSKIVAVVSGHHGVRREGELVLFDPARGRREADGVVQRIPGRGKPVEPVIVDQLVDPSWPRFLHPYPLDDKRFLVACRPTPESPWGIYLADVFDNLVLVREELGWALLEPTPLRARETPPVIVDKVRPERDDAVVYVADVYAGEGLKGVPRGTVKALRVYSFHFAYPNMGGHIQIGVDGPWDVHRILGTAPVRRDGSALFKVPANTPLAVQPLDETGQALQLMRSWMTAMPGETLSCVGCHEQVNSAAPNRNTLAAKGRPDEITPWYGPARGFSFKREVQPVLDRYCVSCHGAGQVPDLTARPDSEGWRGFTPSYLALHPYVRRPGPESDYHLLMPGEFRADTSELIQMLRQGHHGVHLDGEAWDRLITWIDLNAPCHGTWGEQAAIPDPNEQRRDTLRTLFAGLTDDLEAKPQTAALTAPAAPAVEPPTASEVKCDGWPFDAAEAAKRQGDQHKTLHLADGVDLDLVRIPAGTFVMGSTTGAPDEQPEAVVRVGTPFWLGLAEVTNEQLALFDPTHDSGYISETNKDQTRRGAPVNGPRQPVVRVSWDQAMAFCAWLSERTGERATLPTEAQWEYAARAGSASPLPWGGPEADFSPFANLADRSVQRLSRGDSPHWQPRDDRFDDGMVVTADVGHYRGNAWGLQDMHGNAAEWTRTTYRPYPYQADGRDDAATGGRKVVRGGSWYSRPARATSSRRWSYPSWQGAFDVGFRVLVEDREEGNRP